jgi:hypothetical protein
MKLPNATQAVVSRDKIVNYLLNPLHPDGMHKASFFAAVGFRVQEWDVFATALCDLVARFPVTKTVESPHGRKYIVDGAVDTPGGMSAWVRTVWIVDHGDDKPRLVTAYPHEIG